MEKEVELWERGRWRSSCRSKGDRRAAVCEKLSRESIDPMKAKEVRVANRACS